MIIFETYPKGGRILLGRPKNPGNCRYGYGLELQRLTGQTACAYCGVSLVDDYYHWLLMSVDHVVPSGEAKRLRIGPEFYEDLINLVLCCSGCNGFGNRFRLPYDYRPGGLWTLQRFADLRDESFNTRLQSIANRRASEQNFFASQPWNLR